MGRLTGGAEISKYVRVNYGCPTIAGAGIRNASHILKALCLGASAVVLGELLAGVDEAPGTQYIHGSVCVVKTYQSIPEPMPVVQNALDVGDYCGHFNPGCANVAPRVTNTVVPCKGSIKLLCPYLAKGVKYGMQDLGIRSTPELNTALMSGQLRIECWCAFSVQSCTTHAKDLHHVAHPEVIPLVVPAQKGLW